MELKCQNCGHTWGYKGESNHYATCPRCLYKVKVTRTGPGAEEAGGSHPSTSPARPVTRGAP